MGNIDYSELSEITVKTQQELDSIPLDFKGRIYVDCGSMDWLKIRHNYYLPVVIKGNSSVVANENSHIESFENSYVVACGNSSVVANGKSAVEARDRSAIEALENSFVVALDKSGVVARDNSSVVARDFSSVVATGNSSIEAWDKSRVRVYENSSVLAKENSYVEAFDNSYVMTKDNSSVRVYDNSSVEAFDNSYVKAYDNSSVVANGNSFVVAYDNSSVVAYENSSVEAYENSSVRAWGNSSVRVWDNSSVVAWGNVQVVDSLQGAKILISGNARIVYNPKTIQEFMDFFGIKHDKKKAVFYKAVHYDDGKYFSDHDSTFIYVIGDVVKAECDLDVEEGCSNGIHVSTQNWALDFGKDWNDLAILELETDIDKIVLPKNSDGKVRTSEAKVLREVPLEECGLYGKILAKRRSKLEN